MGGIFNTCKTWFSGLAQLKHPALIRRLGEMRMEAEVVERIRKLNTGAKVDSGIIIVGDDVAQLSLGKGASICRGTVICPGNSSRGHGRISIGPDTWIGQYNNLRACDASDIVIGSKCLISQFCTLVSSNHGMSPDKPVIDQTSDTRRLGITLGDDVWLGAGVTILAGATIGNGAVIGANSVVTGSVPAGEIWAGSPARKIGSR